jgi:hypothetical protein
MEPEPCEFVLNDSNQCICKTSNHSGFDFGERGGPSTGTVFFDDVNSIDPYNYDINFELSCKHYHLLNSNTINETQYLLDICKEGNYFIHCSCSWCTYSKNKYLQSYNECFCCKQKLYITNNSNDFIRCADCNSILCRHCFIQGRYNDITYCYDCRKFSIHKNQQFYFTGEYCPRDDWELASFYY